MDEKTFTAQAKCEIARILDDLNFNEFQVDEGIKPSDIYWWAGRMGIDVLAVGTTYKKMMGTFGRPFK